MSRVEKYQTSNFILMSMADFSPSSKIGPPVTCGPWSGVIFGPQIRSADFFRMAIIATSIHDLVVTATLVVVCSGGIVGWDQYGLEEKLFPTVCVMAAKIKIINRSFMSGQYLLY
jgi:hypothetical protein